MQRLYAQAVSLLEPLTRGTLAGSAINVLRIGLQAAAITLLARALGAAGLGQYIGITAVTAILATVSGLGAGQELVRAVSRDRLHFAQHRSHAIRMTLATSAVLLPVAIFFTQHDAIAPLWRAAFYLCAAELLLIPVVQLGSLTLLAHDRFTDSQIFLCGNAALRLIAVVAFVRLEAGQSLTAYAVWHLGASALAASASLFILFRLRADQQHAPQPALGIWNGAVVAASAVSGTTISEIDKVLASKIAGPVTAGLYGAAYRLAAAATAPLVSLAQAMQPRLYRFSHSEGTQDIGVVYRLGLVTVTFAAILGGTVAVLAPYASFVLGNTYQPLDTMGWAFGALTALLCLRAVAGPLLVCLDQAKTKFLLELGTTGLLISSSLHYMTTEISSVLGCVILSESFCVAGQWTAALYRSARLAQSRSATPPTSAT